MSETVTLSRAEWQATLDLVEDLSDQLAIRQSEALRDRLGATEALRLSYTAAETRRIALEEATPLLVWRERAGLTQRALAAAAKVSPSYLAEIEAGRKPGSVVALVRLAAALRIPLALLAGAEA